jgi:Ca2+-binding EF-hand superfamily protein
MKPHRCLTFIALTLSVFFALGPGGRSLGNPEEIFRKRAEDFFKSHDVDEDGYLQGEEIPGDMRNILNQAMASPDTRLNFRQFLQYRETAYEAQVVSFFKNRDRNEDGFLQKHEMPLLLMKSLAKYSHGKERVTFQEFLRFSRDRDFPPPRPPKAEPPKTMGTTTEPPPRSIGIDQSDLDARPIVYRPGKLPKGLPEWFDRLDADQDGQVALFEWRKAGKRVDEFAAWDRNDDGLVTVEEILHKQKADARAPRPKKGPPATAQKETADK